MLNARRENKPATRDSTPALFSTSTVRMWWLPLIALTDLSSGSIPLRSGSARCSASSPTLALFRAEDDVVVRRARGHHRVHLLAVVDAEVDHDRTIVDRVRLLDRGHDVGGVIDAHADTTHRLRPLHVVGQVG